MNLFDINDKIKELELERVELKKALYAFNRDLQFDKSPALDEAKNKITISVWSDKNLKNDTVRKATMSLVCEADTEILKATHDKSVIENAISKNEMMLRENLTDINYYKRMYEIQIHLSKVEGL
jgi:hypothetical protein|tara:strand:+ start:5135 stop:5506 length:372 start_codon:yes stop_codon:yes gene_type:complete